MGRPGTQRGGRFWRKRFAVPLACLVIAACGGSTMPSAAPLSTNEPAPVGAPEARAATPHGAPSASAAAPHAAPSASVAAAPAAPATSSTAAPPAQDTTSTDNDAPPPGAPVVKLVSAGAAPRAKLRYRVKGKHQEQVHLNMQMDMRMSLRGNAMPHVNLPPIEARMSVHESARNDGGADYRYSIDQFATQPGSSAPQTLAAKMDADLAQLVGVTGSASVTARGFVRHSNVNVPSGVDPKTRKLLSSLNGSVESAVVPLPEDPVGVGAQWDVTAHLTVRGMSVKQITHAKLLARHGKHVVIGARVEQTGTPQPIRAPGMPANTRLYLDSLTSTGTSKTRVDLSHLVPARSHTTMHASTVMHITADTLTQTMTSDLTMTMDLTTSAP